MSLSARTSVAAHRTLPHANPLSVGQMNALAHQLAKGHPQTVLEVGCGSGAFSIELAKACNAVITAVDVNPHSLERARKSAEGQSLRGSVVFAEQPATAMSSKFDAVVCIGSSHAFGAPIEGLRQCAGLVTLKGTVLFADIVWSAEPPEEFLAFLGTPACNYWDALDAAQVFRKLGLVISHVETASAESWKSYEDGVLQGRLAFAETLGLVEAEEVRTKAITWAEAYEKHGKHCFGFAAYLASTRCG